MERCSGELASEVPSQASRIARLGDEISGALRAFTSLDLVPCHGDYHPMNVFIDDDGRVTVIDLDTLSSCERESDIAYFCAQTAIMGYFEFGSFGDTLPVREAFLSGYGLPLDSRRLGVYAAEAFLRSLHYDLCILRTNQRTLIDPWLTAAAQCLSGDIRLQ
jgi:Ser/Thr protein kinase RdoA (MazF antagonist)